MDAYQKPSWFKNNVYAEVDTKSFYQLEAIQQEINPDSIDIHLLNACLFFACNKLRVLYKLPPYQINSQLLCAANLHSGQMATYHFFDHNNPYTSALKTPEIRLRACGISYSAEGENCHRCLISEGAYTYIELAQKVIESLFNSPPHRSNLLSTLFQYSACGVALEKSNEAIYLIVTQNFYNN